MINKRDLIKINDYLWEIPKSFRSDMRVAARVYADEKLLAKTFEDRSLEQLINTAILPGIFKYALAMPDIHEGYGFPIGGVAGMDADNGVISPGGVGYDINCGVRVLRSDLEVKDVQPHLDKLISQIQRDVPSGLGRGGGIRLKAESMKGVLERGVKWLVENGYGQKEDIENCEEKGAMAGVEASAVSERAKARGYDQLGTLGSGNHFLEVQRVDEIFDEAVAGVLGLKKDQIMVMIHSGSRGLGHQVCTDYVGLMHRSLSKYKLRLPDQELACAPFNSPEGQQYFGAMASAANFAWANRQMITHLIRESWQRVLGETAGQLNLIYDVAHNIAKIEHYVLDKFQISNSKLQIKSKIQNPKLEKNFKELIIHRKGATRALPAGHPALSEKYQAVGQPVLIPGTMGTASYILVGTEKAKESFYSVCHGAGRVMSRHAAIRQVRGEQLRQDLEKKGILVRCWSNKGLAEEAPLAYKDVDDVVNVVAQAGLARKVARLRPMGVVKG